MPTPTPKAFAGTEKFLWGFVNKLVGMAVGVKAMGPQGCPLEAGAGHGEGGYSSSLPALACTNPRDHGITLKRSGGMTAYLWKRLGLWETLGFMGPSHKNCWTQFWAGHGASDWRRLEAWVCSRGALWQDSGALRPVVS